MSEEIPSLLSCREKPWTEWTNIIENYRNMLSEHVEKNIHPRVCLLPRKDILLYGCCPKMDVRVLCQCEKCGKVMMPSAFVSHHREKHGPDQVQRTPIIAPGTSLLKKKYPHSKSKKKTNLQPSVPPPPLFPKQTTPPPPSPVASAPSDLSPPVLQPVHASKSVTPPPSSVPSSTNNPKHKKSKKNYKTVRAYDPDKHCGVVDGHKGPCLRSITCSNHMVHLRKAVPGRSKDFHQLIADHKAAKDKEINKTNPMPTNTKVETTTTTTSQNTTAYRTIAPTVVKIASTTQQTVTTSTSTKSDIQVIAQPLHITVPSTTVISNSTAQGNVENSSSVVYMPMSPVQFVQLGGPILRLASTKPVLCPPLATQPVVVTIPVQNNNTPTYTSHPKPLIMSTCSTRKIGGTFVLQNERLDRQRSEIQLAANTRRSITNSCSIINTHHKPTILKNSMRSGNIKICAVKRQATDKIASDSKHIRLNDVNGFILHADVSEAAEAPQSNNSVHDKITFINMK